MERTRALRVAGYRVVKQCTCEVEKVGKLCDANQKELIRKSMGELDSRGKTIRALVRAEFMPEDIDPLQGKQRRAIIANNGMERQGTFPLKCEN